MPNKTKDTILTMLIDHSRIIYSAISDMGVFYSAWSEDYEKNKESLTKKKNRMQLTEEDGDAIKIKLIKDFSEAGASDLKAYLDLILRMDNVINSALEFVDILENIHLPEKDSDDIKKRYHRLINNIIKMADGLKTTIKSLRDKPEEVFNNTITIHELENEIDLIFRQFLEYLYSNDSLDIRVLLRIRDSIKILEELADRIHDIADQIRVIVYF